MGQRTRQTISQADSPVVVACALSGKHARVIRPGAISAAQEVSRRFRQSANVVLHRVVALLTLLVVLTSAATVSGQVSLIKAEVASTSPPVRSGAPIAVIWKLAVQSSALVEGRLEVVVMDGPERLARSATDELVLASGEQLYRMVLPPLSTDNPLNAAEMRLRFVGTKQSIDLGTHLLRLPIPWQRMFVVAVCDPWPTRQNAEQHGIEQLFRFETYNPETADRTISTNVVHIRPDELLADPAACFSYDLVLLKDDGLADLKEPQLRALGRWVDAGGSLCVIRGQRRLGDTQTGFLRRFENGPGQMADRQTELPAAPGDAQSESQAVPVTDPQRGAAEGATPAIHLRRWGMGRFAQIRVGRDGAPAAEITDLRRVPAFLWKMRQDQVPNFVSTGTWIPETLERALMTVQAQPNGAPQVAADVAVANNVNLTNDLIAQVRPGEMQLAPVPLQTGDQLLGRLIPRDLRVVPLGLIGLILFVYVAAIGPGDYLLLGAIQRRKYTWLLFPAVTVGFAVGTILLSNWYMEFSDNRRSVTILDVGESNSVARRNEFQVLFRARPGEATTEVSQGYLTPMNHQRFSRATWYTFQQAQRNRTEDQFELVNIPTYEGRMPSRYRATQYLPQWTPQLNRLCSLGAGDTEVRMRWDSLAGLQLSPDGRSMPAGMREAILREVHAAFGQGVGTYVAFGRQIHHVAGPVGLLQQDDPSLARNGIPQPYYAVNQYQDGRNTSFLQDICAPWGLGGLFAVVSQLSPTGGPDFDDLALLDPSDPRQWLLVVIVDSADDLVVYRRLYTGETLNAGR